uniref:Uncharacterized protein n=1 Tax=Panagrolaimus sp. JU765 TaxID=591449 RepID=A0AC34R7C9_9BILA
MSDVETAFELTEYSEYSEPPSETNVSMEGGNVQLLNNFDQNDTESVLSLVSCISSASVYTPAASEANVEFSDSELNDSEEFHTQMLYPQAYITQLDCPERAECDTPVPPMA